MYKTFKILFFPPFVNPFPSLFVLHTLPVLSSLYSPALSSPFSLLSLSPQVLALTTYLFDVSAVTARYRQSSHGIVSIGVLHLPLKVFLFLFYKIVTTASNFSPPLCYAIYDTLHIKPSDWDGINLLIKYSETILRPF